MNLSSAHPTNKSLFQSFTKIKLHPGLVFGMITISALVAFEIFNYSTTDYALRDLLGDLNFAGIQWATILALAFCGIDFAGIARLFTPEQDSQEPKEVWYMFGAWLLAATMNAVLTWWGVSMAIASHSIESRVMIDSTTINNIVPVFVALMVWIIRILLIGSLSTAVNRMFFNSTEQKRHSRSSSRSVRSAIPAASPGMSTVNMAPRVAQRPGNSNQSNTPRPEPTYHSLNTRPAGRQGNPRTKNQKSSAYHL